MTFCCKTETLLLQINTNLVVSVEQLILNDKISLAKNTNRNKKSCAVSFCLLHLELDKKRQLSLHENVANSIKLSEMTANIVRLLNNVTFHFLWLV